MIGVGRKSVNRITNLILVPTRSISKFTESDRSISQKKRYVLNLQRLGEQVNALPTVEQRLVQLNMPKLFKYMCTSFNDGDIPFNGLKFKKFVTRTHIEKNLPHSFYADDSLVDQFCKDIEDEVKETILVNCGSKGQDVGQIFNNLTMMLVRKLQKDHPHLKDSTIDYNPIIDAFWFFGQTGIGSAAEHILKRKNITDYSGLYSDRSLFTRTMPKLVLRTKMPLDSPVEHNSKLSCLKNIEVCEYMPQIYDIPCMVEQRASIIPGYFPGVLNEHGHLFYHGMDSIREFQKKYGDAYLALAHQQLATTIGFAQTYSHAFYQGATPFLDPVRPLTQQTVFSDGKIWVFSVYQLNTSNLSLHMGLENERNNILWLDEPKQLFDTIENNKVMGYNSDVIKTLVKMHMKETLDVPKPEGMRFVMNYDAPSKFIDEFHKQFRRIISGLSISRREPDIAMWEQIYKIDNKTRPQDAKRKWFELPWRRIPNRVKRFDHLYPKYIPRKFRSERLIKLMPRINPECLLKYDEIATRALSKYEHRGPKPFCTGVKIRKQIGDPYLLRDSDHMMCACFTGISIRHVFAECPLLKHLRLKYFSSTRNVQVEQRLIPVRTREDFSPTVRQRIFLQNVAYIRIWH